MKADAQFEVTTLGQPLEVLKTQMAANRSQSMADAFRTVWSRGGVKGFYQGLIPWVRLHFHLPSRSSCGGGVGGVAVVFVTTS